MTSNAGRALLCLSNHTLGVMAPEMLTLSPSCKESRVLFYVVVKGDDIANDDVAIVCAALTLQVTNWEEDCPLRSSA